MKKTLDRLAYGPKPRPSVVMHDGGYISGVTARGGISVRGFGCTITNSVLSGPTRRERRAVLAQRVASVLVPLVVGAWVGSWS